MGCAGPSKDTAEWHAEQGYKLAEQGRYDEAIKNYNEAIRLNPQDAKAYNNRGIAYYYLDHLERAIEDYDKAIRLNPEDAEAYYNWGFAYKLQGKKAEAIADFEKFITLTDNPQLIEMARHEIEELSKWPLWVSFDILLLRWFHSSIIVPLLVTSYDFRYPLTIIGNRYIVPIPLIPINQHR